MKGFDFAAIQDESLEQSPEIFYSRLNSGEEERVRKLVGDLADFMRPKVRGVYREGFLIAGVGGVLRFLDPRFAKDIDLAVVGLKYTATPEKNRNHTFNDVVLFTETVHEYFERLNTNIITELGISGQTVNVGRGSGPFERLDRGYSFGDGKEIASLNSGLESFDWWGSKGLQIAFKDIRPIDIQFVFNQTPDEWIFNQAELEEKPTKAGRPIYPLFPYSILCREQ